jgi:hypothetical protein
MSKLYYLPILLSTIVYFAIAVAFPHNSVFHEQVLLYPRSIPVHVAWNDPTHPTSNVLIQAHNIVLAPGTGSKALIKDLVRTAYGFATSQLAVRQRARRIPGVRNRIPVNNHPPRVHARPILPQTHNYPLVPDNLFADPNNRNFIPDAHAPLPIPVPEAVFYIPASRFHFKSRRDDSLSITVYGHITWAVLSQALSALEDYMQRFNVWATMAFDVFDGDGDHIGQGSIKWDEGHIHMGLGRIRRERL